MEDIEIRPERAGDAAGIGRITAEAFAPMPYSDGTEAQVIERLRAAGALTLSLVATGPGSEIVGHVAFSPVRIDGEPGDWYGLGPVSVAPERQGKGVGGALIGEGLGRLRALGAAGCVLLGNPAYYRRFGFASEPALTYQGKANPYFQRLVLNGPDATGDVSFHPAFDTH